ncbi:Uncharacterized protein Rs2_06216 [Raphanus sativus]|nr:Uncharacterized protein Rs2_06216 [Raphanus sativus]
MAKKKRTPLHKSPPPKHAPPPKTLPSKPAGPSTTRKVPPDSSFSRSGQSIPRSIADPEEQTSVPSGGSDSGPSLAAEEFPLSKAMVVLVQGPTLPPLPPQLVLPE